MTSDQRMAALTKVPAVTLGFWVIKILATTLGETGGDTVSMSWLGETTSDAGASGINGYLVGTALFGVALIVLVWAQIRTRRFNPWLCWATIVASTTVNVLWPCAERNETDATSAKTRDARFMHGILVAASRYLVARFRLASGYWLLATHGHHVRSRLHAG